MKRIEDVITEVNGWIKQMEKGKHKHPHARTQDVIDMLRVLIEKMEKTIENQTP